MGYRVALDTQVDGRNNQEDCLFVHGEVIQAENLGVRVRDEPGVTLLLAVCDGMGGHAAGEWASRFVCEALAEALPVVPETPSDAGELLRRLQLAIVAARRPNCGTTIAGVALRGERAVVFNAGDSRVYKLGRDGLARLSRDHSLVQMYLDRGELAPEAAFDHPHRNVIDFGLGEIFEEAWARDPGRAHVVEDRLLPGECYLICSDGVHDVLRDEEIGALLAGCGQDPGETLAAALSGRMIDNTSFILVSASADGCDTGTP